MPSNSPRDQAADSASKFKLRPVDFDGAGSSSSSDEFDEPSMQAEAPSHQRSGSPPKQADSGSTDKRKGAGMPRSASTDIPESPSQSGPDWSLEPTPVNASVEAQDSTPLPRLKNGKHETPAPPGSVAAARETSASRKPPATAQAPMKPAPSSESSDRTVAPAHSNLPPEIASLAPDQIQQLLANLPPEQLSKILHVIAPSILTPMGIVNSAATLPTAPVPTHRPSSMARANTHPSNVNNRPIPGSGTNPRFAPTVSSTTSRGKPGNATARQDASGAGRGSDSDGELDRDVSVSATNERAESSRLTDNERRPRGRQAAPPDPTAGYKPREGHEYQPRDSRRGGGGAEPIWNYSAGHRPSIPETRQTPSRQVPEPQPLAHSASLPHEDASVAALRIAMETMTREAARAATMEARYQQALAENEKLKETNGAMQSQFDLQLERVLREQQTLRDQMYQQQADRIRVLEDRLKQAHADRQAAQNALRHAEMQAAQRQGDPRREPYVNTSTAPRYPGPPPPPPIDTGLNLSQSQPQPPVRPKEEALHQSPATAFAPRTAAAEGQAMVSPQVDVDARRQRMAKYPPPGHPAAVHPGAPPPAPAPAPAAHPPAVDPNAARGTKRPPPPAAAGSLSASPRPQSQRKEVSAAEDDERARKRPRADGGAGEKTKAQEELELMHHKIAALYEPDQAGNHVCKVCTAHQAPGGGRVGFPRETAPELLAAHAQAEHNGAWELAGRPGKSQ